MVLSGVILVVDRNDLVLLLFLLFGWPDLGRGSSYRHLTWLRRHFNLLLLLLEHCALGLMLGNHHVDCLLSIVKVEGVVLLLLVT